MPWNPDNNEETESEGTEILCGFELSAEDLPAWGDPDKTAYVEVSAADPSGNLRVETLSIVLDNQPPSVALAQINPMVAKSGDNVSLTINFSEPVTRPELLGTPITFTELNPGTDARTAFQWTGTVPEDIESGSHNWKVTAADEVNNAMGEAQTLFGPENIIADLWEVDNNAPYLTVSLNAPLQCETPPCEVRDRYSLNEGYNRVSATVEFPPNDIPAYWKISFVGAAREGALGQITELCTSETYAGSEEYSFNCEHTLDAEDMTPAGDLDGIGLVLAEAIDTAGNLTVETVSVILDNTPPSMISGEFYYTPGPGNPLNDVSKLSTGGSARLLLSASEPAWVITNVTGQTKLQAHCGLTTLDFDTDEVADLSTLFLFQVELNEGVLVNQEIDCPLHLSGLMDDVGNETGYLPIQLDVPPLEVDTLALDIQDPAATFDVSAIKHVRMPFGAVQSNYESAQYVAARDADNLVSLDGAAMSVDVNGDVKQVRFFDAESGGTLQGTAANLNNAIKLESVDSPELFAEVVDYSGNISERVRVVSEYVTTFAEDEDALKDNPVEWLRDGPSPIDVSDHSLFNMEQRNSGSKLHYPASWRKRDGLPPQRQGFGLTYDATRHVTVMFGGESVFGDWSNDPPPPRIPGNTMV